MKLFFSSNDNCDHCALQYSIQVGSWPRSLPPLPEPGTKKTPATNRLKWFAFCQLLDCRRTLHSHHTCIPHLYCAPHCIWVRKAGYLRSRGKHSTSCLIGGISLPVLPITKVSCFILEGKSREVAGDKGTPINSPEREGACVNVERLMLSKRLYDLIGSPAPWDLSSPWPGQQMSVTFG